MQVCINMRWIEVGAVRIFTVSKFKMSKILWSVHHASIIFILNICDSDSKPSWDSRRVVSKFETGKFLFNNLTIKEKKN